MLQQLKSEYLQKILTNELLKGKIAHLLGKSAVTIYRYAKENNLHLTLPAVLDTIREHEALPKDAELTEERNAVAA